MRFYTQSFLYDDPWSIVSLAYFLRYPNPLANHILSCDVVSRTFTSTGTLLTTRLILKKGSLPRWAQGFIPRAESWIVEESEVDPVGRVVRCSTRNLDHVKVLSVEERQLFRQTDNGTLQTTEARFVSGLGWGLTKRIENHGLARFKANIQRSREGVSLVLSLIRQSRTQPLTMGASNAHLGDSHTRFTSSEARPAAQESARVQIEDTSANAYRGKGPWTKFTSWLRIG